MIFYGMSSGRSYTNGGRTRSHHNLYELPRRPRVVSLAKQNTCIEMSECAQYTAYFRDLNENGNSSTMNREQPSTEDPLRLVKWLKTDEGMFFEVSIMFPILRIFMFFGNDNYFPFSLFDRFSPIKDILEFGKEHFPAIQPYVSNICLFWILMQFVTHFLVYFGVFERRRSLMYPYLIQTLIEFAIFSLLFSSISTLLLITGSKTLVTHKNIIDDPPIKEGFKALCAVVVYKIFLTIATFLPFLWFVHCIKVVWIKSRNL